MTENVVQWNKAIRSQYPDSWSGPGSDTGFHFGPELVLFDLDGTLIDSVPDLASAVDHMLQVLEREPVGAERVATWVGNGADKLVRRALADGDEWLADGLDDDAVATAREHFDQSYMRHLHHATGVYEGVSQIVSELKSGLARHVALVTNKPRMFTEPLLVSLGWERVFDCVVCGDDLDEKKPSPKPLLYVCEQLNIEPCKSLMIGDSRSDILAAKMAGMSVAAVSYGYNHGEDIALSQPDWIVHSMLELVNRR